METKWTPEPWITDKREHGDIFIYSKTTGQFVAKTIGPFTTTEIVRPDAMRIVSCVNAMQGRDPGCIEKMEKLIESSVNILKDNTVDNFKRITLVLTRLEAALESARVKE